jgi:hypothetical protein
VLRSKTIETAIAMTPRARLLESPLISGILTSCCICLRGSEVLTCRVDSLTYFWNSSLTILHVVIFKTPILLMLPLLPSLLSTPMTWAGDVSASTTFRSILSSSIA